MKSFKAKLVVYFLLLALLPTGAVFWAFSSLASQGDTHRADARLEAGLRAGLVAYQQTLDRHAATAERLAHDPAFQRALEQRDIQALERRLRGTPPLSVTLGNGRTVGTRPAPIAARQTAAVYTQRGLAGTVVASMPLDAALAAQLRRASGLTGQDALAIQVGTRVVAAAPAVAGSLTIRAELPHTASVGGRRYRVLESGAFAGSPAVRLVTLTPQHAIDAATWNTRKRLLLFLGLMLIGVGLFAYTQGRTIARTLSELVVAAGSVARGRLDRRVPVRGRDEFAQLAHAFNEMADQLDDRLAELASERGRLQEAFTRFGDALSATHEPDQLLRLVLDATVEATGARGAFLIDDRGGLVRVGDVDTPGERLELPLVAGQASFGRLVLVGESFGDDERLTANSLAAHAVVALENARLHRIVERQALVDGLTGLANRRQSEEALSAELARSARFGTPLTAVLADLDDFKQVNDLYGHATGDLVLREFAAVLRESVREADVAGRWGGEEFLLLLPGTDAAGAEQLAERIRKAFEQRTILGSDGRQLRLTCSFGAASYPAAADGADLLAAADDALYRAKHAGKNQVVSAAGSPRP